MKRNQHGMTTATALLLILIGIVLLRAVMVIVPIYFDDTEIGIVLDNMEESGKVNARSSERSVKDELERRLRNNNIQVTTDKLIVKRDRNTLTIDWTYENRGHFLANIDFVLTFQHQKVITSE
ncbi:MULTISPECIES: DUF4845 domain-containing protein [Thalassolituus]|jgi:hypothetical protein|uniref:DUF4845 domain-containing protein n=1 Tax=Thalassolituus TaxID=187492 RepID=UPI000C3F6F84|nr:MULTISPECIES: DUF4845 domain-containing protein [Thalassolituus]MAG43655.1 hypothetical protein [Oceanospirillaceae bacterium]MEC8909132.1 DUF4845 domain-containing protein [Pseudomonadota bacterium]HCG77699.1 hypothetical protein [Oceanospirillales bacterium]MAX86928.1 hypothetical protein [Oceanospirillaceae bacterium]MEC9255697.1 DUF4845 domain-containing protein [Pseudomonadota bacterium]|tara:strand:- start:339 stop:707 length:369 start_codon:yes stop_codon:yes gene_type:complete